MFDTFVIVAGAIGGALAVFVGLLVASTGGNGIVREVGTGKKFRWSTLAGASGDYVEEGAKVEKPDSTPTLSTA